jgi:hypothetical protein
MFSGNFIRYMEDNSELIRYDEIDYEINQTYLQFNVEVPNKQWVTDDGLHHRMVKGQ